MASGGSTRRGQSSPDAIEPMPTAVISLLFFGAMNSSRGRSVLFFFAPAPSTRPWGITYGSILGRMNTHVPPILMFTRGFVGFDPLSSSDCRECGNASVEH